MTRLTIATALAALLIAAPAQAKGLISVSVCGTNGCHTTRDARELSDAQDSIPQADPGVHEPYFRLRIKIGEPGQRRVMATQWSRWLPSVGVIRGFTGFYGDYSMPTPATRKVLERLSGGLRPYGARIETNGGTSWEWALLAVIPAALVLAMRRRGRWI